MGRRKLKRVFGALAFRATAMIGKKETSSIYSAYSGGGCEGVVLMTFDRGRQRMTPINQIFI